MAIVSRFWIVATLLAVTTVGVVSAVEEDDTSCQTRINYLRTKYGVSPLIQEREDLHSCVNRQSEYDKYNGAHSSYKRCGALGSQGSGGGSTCAGVIDMFFHERWKCTDDAVLFDAPIQVSQQSGLNNCRRACMDDASCLSFDYDGTATNQDSCRFYGDASHTHVHPVAPGDTTAFYLGYPSLLNTAAAKKDAWVSFSMIETDGANKVPSSGIVTHFKWYGENPSGVHFFMYRLDQGNTYQVIGYAYAASTIVGAENILTAPTEIAVQEGDMIGWTWDGAPAFGFDDAGSSTGATLYRNENDSGGPTAIGETWSFDGGPTGRQYHVTATFVPSSAMTYPTTGRRYCSAGICNGHCGPVMGASTTTFAWGTFQGHYTLNWRPNPRLPGGDENCPSGISTVKCWTDPNTNILWAYGVGGDTCHSTCSLAGATSSDYMCDIDTPIDGDDFNARFDQVAAILANFENPYNGNDPDGLTCTTGTCWGGEVSNQIAIHESNSDCYLPRNTTRFSCNAKFGNANCYGQRFNQVCPCIVGCSQSALGDEPCPVNPITDSPFMSPTTENPTSAPTQSPSEAPSTSNPTSAPTSAPTESPSTVSPTSSPTQSPSEAPSTSSPTTVPTSPPTQSPSTAAPTTNPTLSPSLAPSTEPPTLNPADSPTTQVPTGSPTQSPTSSPSESPSTTNPTVSPSMSPTTSSPTGAPSTSPSTTSPTRNPTGSPTESPSTMSPTTSSPTGAPSASPSTFQPTSSPTGSPTESPSTLSPTTVPPTGAPSVSPSTAQPTVSPTDSPTESPSTRSPSTSSPTDTPTETSPCNENGICDLGETCLTCPNDCAHKTNGNNRYCCAGNDPSGTCGHKHCTCWSDVMMCGGNQASCTDHGDCCSGKCKWGTCRGWRRLGEPNLGNGP